MPPKKKKGKGKKKGKKSKKEAGVLTADDKLKQTQAEIEALKDHLSIRKEFARRSQADSQEWKSRMKEVESTLEEQEDIQRDVSADMTRQYKTMQTDMGLRIHQLETMLARTTAQLELTERELKETKEEKDKMCGEKDLEIKDLRLKIDSMSMQYEQVLHNTLDRVVEKIAGARDKWEEDTTLVHGKNKQTLLQFGLNPLDL